MNASQPSGIERLVGNFLDHLRVERGVSVHTVAGYRRDLRRYAEFLSARAIGDPENVVETDVTAFVAHLRHDAGLAPSSVARAVVAVRSLHRFAVEERVSLHNPAAEVRPPSLGTRLPKALGLADVQALLDVPDRETPTGLRDAALLELLYGTGARISEVLDLDVDDVTRLVEPEDSSGLRLIGKGNHERVVPLGSFARRAMSDWLVRGRPIFAQRRNDGAKVKANSGRKSRLDTEPANSIEGGGALLLNARGGRLSRQSAFAILRRVGDLASVAADISPHTLRHSYATHLLDGGADVRVVQELLGHASVTTTQIYTLVTVDHLREVYLSSHPRAY